MKITQARLKEIIREELQISEITQQEVMKKMEKMAERLIEKGLDEETAKFLISSIPAMDHPKIYRFLFPEEYVSPDDD